MEQGNERLKKKKMRGKKNSLILQNRGNYSRNKGDEEERYVLFAGRWWRGRGDEITGGKKRIRKNA